MIGGVNAEGRYTGFYALLTSGVKMDVDPRLMAYPGLDTPDVSAQLAVLAEKLRAFAYISTHGQKTIEGVKTYRKTFSQRELMIIYPDFIACNAQSGKNETLPATAYALRLRAKVDAKPGWHKSLSNVALDGVLGISAYIWWSLQGKDTDASDLNVHHVTTLIKRDGFRFWGNRTCDADVYVFEPYTRTTPILADMIAGAHFSYMDKTLTSSLVKDMVDGINRKGMQLVTAGWLLGFSCWYDPADNPKETLREGQAHIRYKYTPVPPL